MLARVWYEPGKEFYIIEFINDSIFALPEWAVGQEQSWGAIWHHLLVTNVDNKLLYHRIAIELQHRPLQFIKGDLETHLRQFARSLQYVGLKSGQYNPPGYTSLQCLRAAEILGAEHDALLQRLIAANPEL